ADRGGAACQGRRGPLPQGGGRRGRVGAPQAQERARPVRPARGSPHPGRPKAHPGGVQASADARRQEQVHVAHCGRIQEGPAEA
ncbi:hypothetical protein LTR16_012835, partial [Cryomyces antarcticus]